VMEDPLSDVESDAFGESERGVSGDGDDGWFPNGLERTVMGEGGTKLALLRVSCLVLSGVGVDGLRDSLSTTRKFLTVKKKVKGWLFPASLTQYEQDN